ncbi:hypothetical protein [Streptomyces johnsoniae]|uniref:Transferase n=1 Tax=Streptomyces johnsoniae TaxID=3075532 RepID=A0ABU2RXN3_9ACTN|nr:hypothetical protein [Streptomyces sp. DSM 41886]MDT0441516.1 hypothetical protein [Streptomyces sp. DSM 41886]
MSTGTIPKDKLPRADCTMDADGRLTVELGGLREAREPVLCLALRPKKGEEETTARTVPLEPAETAPGTPGTPGRWRAELPAEPPLEEGRWDVFVLNGPDAARQRVVPGLRDLRALAPGERTPAADPLAVRLPYATKDGYFAIRAWLRPAHAEAGDLKVAARGLTVRGRLLGARPGLGGTAVFRLRGSGGTTVKAPLHDEGDGAFSFTAEYAELPPGQDPATPAVWDVFVKPSVKSRRVRVARLLDDVADRKPVFVYPATTVEGATYRPYYTVDNDLALEVAAPPSAG